MKRPYLAPLLALAACGPQESAEQEKPIASKRIAPELQGSYLESWGPEPSQQSRHEFQAASWRRQEGGDFPGNYTLNLQVQSKAGPGLWALRFRYATKQAVSGQELRIDLFSQEKGVLWLCLHPEASLQKKSLKAAPASPKDLEGRGCYGRPWRKLQRD